jgi:hypothetical protein
MSVTLAVIGLLIGTVAFMGGLMVQNNGFVLLGLLLIPSSIVWGLVSAPRSPN